MKECTRKIIVEITCEPTRLNETEKMQDRNVIVKYIELGLLDEKRSPFSNITNVRVLKIDDSYRDIDDFEAAGFSEEVCEVCRNIQMECGVSSEVLLSLLRTFDNKK